MPSITIHYGEGTEEHKMEALGTTGGGGAGTSGPAGPAGPIDNKLTPEKVYSEYRPSDWIPMPTPNEDEIYLLIESPVGVPSLFAFVVTCNGNFTVEIGDYIDGQLSYTPYRTYNSGRTCEYTLSEDTAVTRTSENNGQKILKITGSNITSWAPTAHSGQSADDSTYNWNIVEISANLPNCSSMRCTYLPCLKFFTLHGTNNIYNVSSMFAGCCSLLSIPCFDMSKINTLDSTFSTCYSLVAIPNITSANISNMRYAFNECSALTNLPSLDTSKVTNMERAFYNCRSVKHTPEYDFSNVTSMKMAFSYCTSLISVPDMSLDNAVSLQDAFSHCASLKYVGKLNTPKATDFVNIFNNCPSLVHIESINIKSAGNTSLNGSFSGCNALSYLCFSEDTVGEWWKRPGFHLGLSYTNISAVAFMKLFSTMPAIHSSYLKGCIYLKGTPATKNNGIIDNSKVSNWGWALYFDRSS